MRCLIKRCCLAVLPPSVDAEVLVVVNHSLDLCDPVADIDHVVAVGKADAGNVETLGHDVNLHTTMQECRVGHLPIKHHMLWGA